MVEQQGFDSLFPILIALFYDHLYWNWSKALDSNYWVICNFRLRINYCMTHTVWVIFTGCAYKFIWSDSDHEWPLYLHHHLFSASIYGTEKLKFAIFSGGGSLNLRGGPLTLHAPPYRAPPIRQRFMVFSLAPRIFFSSSSIEDLALKISSFTKKYFEREIFGLRTNFKPPILF